VCPRVSEHCACLCVSVWVCVCVCSVCACVCLCVCGGWLWDMWLCGGCACIRVGWVASCGCVWALFGCVCSALFVSVFQFVLC